MERNDKLVRSNSALAGTGKSFLTLQERSLLSELDLTATNSKTVLEPRLGAEFVRALVEFPAEAIEAAFRGWRDVSPYFPAISQIRELAQAWVKRQKEIADDNAALAEKQKIDTARQNGQLVDFADIKTELLSIAQFPVKTTERQRKQKVAIERLRRAEMPRAVQLTKQQIEDRRAAEQEEIRRYESNA